MSGEVVSSLQVCHCEWNSKTRRAGAVAQRSENCRKALLTGLPCGPEQGNTEAAPKTCICQMYPLWLPEKHAWLLPSKPCVRACRLWRSVVPCLPALWYTRWESMSTAPKHVQRVLLTSQEGEQVSPRHPTSETGGVQCRVARPQDKIDSCCFARSVQAHLVLLHFALSHFQIFTNCWFVATLNQASPSAPFFQQHLLTSFLCVTFW